MFPVGIIYLFILVFFLPSIFPSFFFFQLMIPLFLNEDFTLLCPNGEIFGWYGSQSSELQTSFN